MCLYLIRKCEIIENVVWKFEEEEIEKPPPKYF